MMCLSLIVRRLMDFHASEVNEVLVSASLLITSDAILTLRAGYNLIFGSVYITPSTHIPNYFPSNSILYLYLSFLCPFLEKASLCLLPDQGQFLHVFLN